jgi:hypothetical protein
MLSAIMSAFVFLFMYPNSQTHSDAAYLSENHTSSGPCEIANVTPSICHSLVARLWTAVTVMMNSGPSMQCRTYMPAMGPNFVGRHIFLRTVCMVFPIIRSICASGLQGRHVIEQNLSIQLTRKRNVRLVQSDFGYRVVSFSHNERIRCSSLD